MSQRNLLLYLLLAFLFSVSLFYFLQKGYFNWKINNFLVTRDKEKQSGQEVFSKKYREILDKGLDKKSTERAADEVIVKRKAIGKQRLEIILIRPANLPESKIEPLITKLKQPNSNVFQDCETNNLCFLNVSLNHISTFLSKESKKYQINDFDLEVKAQGPYVLTDLKQIGDLAQIWGKDPFGVVKLQDTFQDFINNLKINIPKDELVVFLYFDNSFTPASQTEKNSLYEHKKFRSFADDYLGRAYVNVYNFSTSFSKTITEIVIHELLHLFGASDKYNEDKNLADVCSDRGRGDLSIENTKPQSSADVMCGFVEYQPSKFQRATLTDNNLVINELTAKEIGWRK